MDGFVHTQDAGLGARKPATSSNWASSALDDTRHVDGSTLLSATAAGVDAVGDVACTSTPLEGTTFGAGGRGAGASPHAARAAATKVDATTIELRVVFIAA
jgi:hypothetical protein